MIKGQTIIVIDLSNYKFNCQEKIPFKAMLNLITDYPCYWIKSLTSGNRYEVYKHQILEGLEIEELSKIIDLSKYGT